MVPGGDFTAAPRELTLLPPAYVLCGRFFEKVYTVLQLTGSDVFNQMDANVGIAAPS